MKAVLRNLSIGAIFGVVGIFLGNWLYSKPKPITVSFNGWHGKDFLKQGCIVLQRENERFTKLSPKEWVALYSLTGKSHMACMWEPDVMNRGIENQLLSAFASNPQCQGISFSQGFYDPKTDATTEAGKQFMSADWRLSLDLTPSDETGEVSLPNSQWSLNPKSRRAPYQEALPFLDNSGRHPLPQALSGPLVNIEKASTDICTIVKAQGGKI